MTRFRSIAERGKPSWTLGTGMILAVIIVACTTTTPEQRTQIAQLTVLQVCDAYSGALSVLAPQRAMGTLTVSEIETINTMNTAVDPICSAETPPADPGAAIDQVKDAITEAMYIFDSHNKKGL